VDKSQYDICLEVLKRLDDSRRPGALKGKIKIADDFDELPSDIADAFGMVDK